MLKSISKLCTPAKIYFAIAVISSMFALMNRVPMVAVFVNLVFACVWTYILGWLCTKGYRSISWFLVLLPYIIIALAMLGIYHVSRDQTSLLRMIKLQGAYGQEAFRRRRKYKK
jgi:hypothetical protein